MDIKVLIKEKMATLQKKTFYGS